MTFAIIPCAEACTIAHRAVEIIPMGTMPVTLPAELVAALIRSAEDAETTKQMVCNIINEDAATWPDHGSAPLAIAAMIGFMDREIYRLRAKLYLKPDDYKRDPYTRLTPERESFIRSAINPAYANQIGTESHERSILLNEIDMLRAQVKNVGQAPEGWKLVPIDPTPEMWAATKTMPDVFGVGDEYRAMIAAAPPTPTVKSRDGFRRIPLTSEQIARLMPEPVIGRMNVERWSREQMFAFAVNVIRAVDGSDEMPHEQARASDPPNLTFANALDHIAKVAAASRSQTRRIRWIEQRALTALRGEEYRDGDFDLPKSPGPDTQEKLQKRMAYHIAIKHELLKALKEMVENVLRPWSDMTHAEMVAFWEGERDQGRGDAPMAPAHTPRHMPRLD